MSNQRYKEYLQSVDEIFTKHNINTQNIRTMFAQELMALDAIHHTAATNIDDLYSKGVFGKIENVEDFIFDIFQVIGDYGDLNLNDSFYRVLKEPQGIGLVESGVAFDGVFGSDVGEFAHEVIDAASELDENLKLVIDNNQPSFDEALNIFNKLPEDVKLSALNNAKGFTGQPLNISFRADSIVYKYLLNQGELTRSFLQESLGHRLLVELYNSLDDSVEGKYLEEFLNEANFQSNIDVLSPSGDEFIKQKHFGSVVDITETLTDEVYYGVSAMLEMYMQEFRNNFLNYITGTFDDLYENTDLVKRNNKINRQFENAIGYLSEALQSKDPDIFPLFGEELNEMDRRLLGIFDNLDTEFGEVTSSKSETFFDTIKQFKNPDYKPSTEVLDDFDIRLMSNSDAAIKTMGVPIAFEDMFVNIRNNLTTGTPFDRDIFDLKAKTIADLKKTVGVDNYSSVFDIALKEPMHMRPINNFIKHSQANKNLKIEMLDGNTGKFFPILSDNGKGNISKILKQRVGIKAPDDLTVLDSLVIRVTPVKETADSIQEVQNFVRNMPSENFTPPEFRKIADTPEDIARSVDKNKLAQAEDVLKNTDVGRHISGTALDFAKKAGKVGFGTGMTAVAPGDVIIEQGIKRLLPKLGLAFISAPALAAYTAYEMALLAADVGKGLSEAKNRGDEESFKSAFWDGFTEDAYSDKYSIGYALTKEIHETLFQDVYGRIAQEYLPGSED
tara:strand:- start:11973 stop:14159 length:2187 start_codon:yes stop_codon:yes gene_type:complete